MLFSPRWPYTSAHLGLTSTVSFHSILFDRREDDVSERLEQPPFFGDLHLDQILASLTAGRDEYRLEPFFYRPLHEVEAVRYRHHVLRDLEQNPVLEAVREFARGMRQMREHVALVEKLHYGRQKQRWFLEAVAVYCDAVGSLLDRLAALELGSRGFIAWREYLAGYTESNAFTSLVTETRDLQDELADIRYAVHIKGNRVRVSHYEGEPDISAEVEQTFAKFKQGAVNDYRVKFREHAEMNHVEAQILDLVAKLHPETFSKLDEYCAGHQTYLDETIGRFDREVQFYLAYREYIEPLKAKGLAFSHPRVSARSKDVHVAETFDLALATKLVQESASVVCNDFHLTDSERILVVSGPNNGGKTTFARMFGQLHYLASLGLPVPGVDARLFLSDQIFTHFEREEDIETLRGKFEDELFRIRAILDQATSDSVLIMNESFGSTTLRDALVVGAEVMKLIIELDVLCVFVTFVDELASLSESNVSMMSTVVPEDPAVRTYKVVRKPADGLAYAAAIAEKYCLTYESLKRRIAR
ncbi:MAG: MutS-related protein [Solirubrobacteraceae bacterium]